MTYDPVAHQLCLLAADDRLWSLLLELDEALAATFDDGSPFHAGVREGLERAAVLVRAHRRALGNEIRR